MLRKTFFNIIIYGACLGLLSVLIVWGKYRLLVIDHSAELYALLIGIIFVIIGAWLGSRLIKPRTVIQQEIIIREVEVPTEGASRLFIADSLPPASGISQRELDVLVLLAKGLSNEEIAGQLFVSQNTVKTHLSNLYFKLDVKRRTQAVEKARLMGLLGPTGIPLPQKSDSA